MAPLSVHSPRRSGDFHLIRIDGYNFDTSPVKKQIEFPPSCLSLSCFDNDTRLQHGKSAEQALGVCCNGLGQDFGLWLPEKDGQKG